MVDMINVKNLVAFIKLASAGMVSKREAVEALGLSNDFWHFTQDQSITEVKLKAIGISPDFLSGEPTIGDWQKELDEIREDYDALESGSLSLEEMEKHWAEADASLTMRTPRRRKHLSSR
jgi:hypothetical protein